MKLILKPLIIVLLFLIIQWGVFFLAGLIFHPIPPLVFLFAYLIIGLSITACLYFMHMLQMRTFDPGYISRSYAHLGVIAALLGIFVADLISGMYRLPDLMQPELYKLARHRWGALTMVCIVPLTEELVFREGVIGYLRNHDVGRWTAIIASSILFALVHFNPAQIPTAFVAGILLGIVYIKSRSIVLTTIIHAVNNFVAVMELRHLGAMAEGFTFNQILGHRLTLYYILICSVLGYLFMRDFMKKYHRPSHRHGRHRHHRH